ncbi:MAG: YbfB/YjiJ family MFS transporter [Pseudomonadota bacterium]
MNRSNDASPSSWWPTALAGFCATLIGLGLGRFSYVALLPLLIDAQWTSTAGAAQLAAANLIGYMIGALGGHRLALKTGAACTIRGALVTVLLSMLSCSVNLGLEWLWFWRLAAGIAGGMLMILAVPYAASRVPVAVRGKAIGVVFAGIGGGIILSGFVVPLLGAEHPGAAWLALSACVALALAFAWPRFSAPETPAAPAPRGRLMPRGALLALLLAYALDAIGYLPHTVFWVEYLVHGLHRPVSTGGIFWALFGAGAVIGPLLSGYAADRFGFRNTLIACFAVKALAVGLPLVSTSTFALFVSSLVVGALTPGLVAVVSGRVIEIVGPAAHQPNWAMLTFVYAGMQALAGYAMATLYAATHSFDTLFAIGAGVLGVAAVILSLGGEKRKERGAGLAR